MKRLILLFVFINVFVLTSCQRYDIINENNVNYLPINPIPKDSIVDITLYFPDRKSKTIQKELRVVESQNSNIVELVIKELLNGPESRNLFRALPKNLKVLSAEVIDEIAYLNISIDSSVKNVSEDEEAFVLYSIVNSLVELENIDKVQILINGGIRDVFYNHFDIKEPLSFNVFITSQEYSSPVQPVIEYYESITKEDYRNAFEQLYLTNRQGVKYSSVESFLKSSYGNIINFDLNSYVINNYGSTSDITVDFTVLTNGGMTRIDENEEYELTFSEGKFKITNILN